MFLLDNTGSMFPVREQVVEGFNGYIDGLKDTKIKFTMQTFNSIETKTLYNREDVDAIKKMKLEDYKPNGATPLYDALFRIVKVGEKSKLKKKLVVILTDGYENASRMHSYDDVVNLIKERTDEGWTFIYLGADQDAWAVARDLGLSQGNVFAYNSADTLSTYRTLASKTAVFTQSGVTQTANFFEQDDDESA